MHDLPPQLALSFIAGSLAAAGAACVSIPIIIHLLTRMRRRPQRWGAMKFLLEAYRRHRTRLQMEQWLLLLVRCLILLVLGLALAGPLLELSGCAAGDAGLDGDGRMIYLVIDDSLSAQAATGDDGAARFERQREAALKIIDGLSGKDAVALVRAARPARASLSPPTIDRALARRRVEQLEPRFGSTDLPAAVALVRDSIRQRQTPADRAIVFLLSDFSPDAATIGRGVPQDLAALNAEARIIFSKPAPGEMNVQVARLQPRRHLVLTGIGAITGSGGVTQVPVDIVLRRFGDNGAAASTIELSLFDDDPTKPLAVFDPQTYRWQEGETQVSLSATLLLREEHVEAIRARAGPPPVSPAPADSGGTTTGGSVVIRARIEPDALEADNERLAVLELRPRLRVGIIGDPDQSRAGLALGADQQSFTANDWLRFALSPSEAAGGGVDMVQLPAIETDGQQLAPLDAAMVLRPDLLPDAGWRGLRDLAERGGMVWLFAPAPGGPATWAEAIRSRLGLDFQLSLDPQTLAPPDEPTAEGMRLDIDRPEPELLSALAADFKDLLRPVRVRRRYEITATGGDDAVWLATEDGRPLLVAGGVGDGFVLVLGSALDLTWTNLPTRPLFVPLLHESLRSAAARSASAARLANVIVGDQPALGRAWDDAAQIERVGASSSRTDEHGPLLLRRTDDGFVPVEPLERPGVYRAAPQARGRLIPVNIDPAAGDTTAVPQAALEAWLAPLGELRFVDESDPAAALSAFESRRSFTRHLLWATMALVLLELLLARWFSHAKRDGAVGAATMLLNRFAGKIKPHSREA